jgi:hypothetical protein
MQVIYYLLVNSGLLSSTELAPYQSPDEAYFSKRYDISPQQLIANAGVDVIMLADQYTALQSFGDVKVDTAVLTPMHCEVFDEGSIVLDLRIKIHAVDGIGAVLKSDKGAVIIEQIKQPHQLTQQQAVQPQQQQDGADTANNNNDVPAILQLQSPAVEAGLLQGDIITSIGDNIVVDVQEANNYITSCSAAANAIAEYTNIQVIRRIAMTIKEDDLPNSDIQPFNHLCATLLENGSSLEHPFT